MGPTTKGPPWTPNEREFLFHMARLRGRPLAVQHQNLCCDKAGPEGRPSGSAPAMTENGFFLSALWRDELREEDHTAGSALRRADDSRGAPQLNHPCG